MSFWTPGAIPASQVLFGDGTVESELIAQEAARISAIERASSGPANVALSFASDQDRWDVFGDARDNTIQTRFGNRWVVTAQTGLPALDPAYRWFFGAEFQIKDAGDVILCELYLTQFGTAPAAPILLASNSSQGTNVDGAVVNVPASTEVLLNLSTLPASLSARVTSGPSASNINLCRLYGVQYALRAEPFP